MKRNIFTILGLILIVYMVLFLDIPIDHYRIIQELWNSGHIFLFILISFYLYKKVFNKYTFPLYLEILSISIISIIIGGLIEYIQSFTGRDSSYYDVALDTIGGLIGVLLFSNSVKKTNKIKRVFLHSSIVVLFIYLIYPMLIVAIDDIYQRIEFPAIISTNSSREVTRFDQQNIKIEFVDSDLVNGKSDKILKLLFNPGKYSTAVLGTGIQDWSKYNYLAFTIYNPELTSTTLNIRIHDDAHSLSGNQFYDRYNRKLTINSGWNEIKISLYDVKNSPTKRKMDMQKVDQIMLYKSNLTKTEILYLAGMRLSE